MMGEALVVASPLSTTPHAHECLGELHVFLDEISRTGNDINSNGNSKNCLEQLSSDLRQRQEQSIQVFRSSYCGLALYYLVVRDLAPKAFSVLLGTNVTAKYAADQVQGAVVCAGVSGLYYAQAATLHSLATRLEDAVRVMRQMEGDPEDCKMCLKAFMSTLLCTDDEERRTNGMVDAELPVIKSFEPEAVDDKPTTVAGRITHKVTKRNGVLSSGASSRRGGLNAAVGNGAEKITGIKTTSADMARLMEKQSAVFSVAEKDCRLRRYEQTGQQRRTSMDLGGRVRRRKRVDEADLKDFDFQPTESKSVAPLDISLSFSSSSVRLPSSASIGSLQRKDRPTKALPAPRGGAGNTRRPSSAQAKLWRQQQSQQQQNQQQKRQAAFDAFGGQQDDASHLSGSFNAIAFPGLDDNSQQQQQTTTTNQSGRGDDSIASLRSKGGISFGSFDPFSPDSSLAGSSAAPRHQHRLVSPVVLEEEPTLVPDDFVPDTASTSTRSRIQVNIALNEDLTCSYKQSKISSCTIEGVVQVQVRSEDPNGSPFFLLLRDPSKHIRMIQENRRYAEDKTETLSDHNEEDIGVDYKFTISVPRADNYFPVMRYKCNPELRPVPIVSFIWRIGCSHPFQFICSQFL